MTYEEMANVLNSCDESVDVTYYGKDDGKWQYAVVKGGDMDQSMFPIEKTISCNDGFVVSLLRDFDGEDDECETLLYCEQYCGQ